MNLLDVLSIYQLEDEAQSQVDVAEAMLNNFEREPFLELRYIVISISIFFISSGYMWIIFRILSYCVKLLLLYVN